MTRIGYDMMAIGNHEFDNGVESFADNFIANVTEDGRTAFPITGCNIDFSSYESFQTIHSNHKWIRVFLKTNQSQKLKNSSDVQRL